MQPPGFFGCGRGIAGVTLKLTAFWLMEGSRLMKKLLSVGLLLIFMGSFAFTHPEDFNPGTEPDGFRGIKWGTPISTLEDMHAVWDGGDRKYYERKDDSLEIAGAKLHRIIYTFWQGQFSEVKIDILKDYTNPQDKFAHFKILREVCFERFGARRKVLVGSEEYSWFGTASWVKLVRDDPGSLHLTMGSRRLLEQKESYEKEKTRREQESRQALARQGKGF
jgi:hypothetical protein